MKTILNQISNKKLSDFPKIYQQNKDYIKKHRRFNIMFSSGFLGVRKKHICRNILDPLIPSIKNVLIYELQEKCQKVQNFKPYLVKKNGRHILNLSGEKWEYFLPLLFNANVFSTIHEIRGSILLHCLNDNIPWEKIFKNCFGPFTISNPSVGCGKVALNYAKINSDHQSVFIIIEKINSGLESITITCNTDMVCKIFDTAVKHCRLTSMKEDEYVIIEKHENVINTR